MNIIFSTILQVLVLAVQVGAAVYGVWSEISPETLPITPIPKGMGTGLAAIALTMVTILAVLFVERRQRDSLRKEIRDTEEKAGKLLKDISGRVSLSVPFHERDFYSLWRAQVRMARNMIDVTHLGPKPPKNRHGKEEKDYFDNLRDLYSTSRAQIRRVERLTWEKIDWISELAEQFNGFQNVSLRAYPDPSNYEMPFAISVSRVDDNFAWLVALAEHESTMNYRDVLLTGSESVQLLGNYFTSRLWDRSIPVLDHGKVINGWRQKVENELCDRT